MTPLDLMPDDVEGWLRELPDSEFDRLWVGAVMSSIIEDDLSMRDLSSLLRMVRDRMRLLADNGTFNLDTIKIHNQTMARASLNPTQVRIIRKVEGVSQRALADVFGVTQGTISRAKAGKCWYGTTMK